MEEIRPSTSPVTPLRRRNSIATTTAAITSDIPFAIDSSTPTSFDFELITLKPSSFVAYTSLRDILSSPSSSSFNIPSINGHGSSSTVGDISIRNPLVKQAAWSYLQATALTSSEDSAGSQFLRRIWLHFSAGIQFLRRMFDWIFQSIRIPFIAK
ncbi:unnamed protein product [Microthlaspi erraticum]|uniref:Uncharacterized protein n=1 Tax=Microthlaspi erraticum TaxID=1685480 RepID=A0A6D2IFE8_9BRAS|nr:unnamed protein product [Microthlaspi erraticum]